MSGSYVLWTNQGCGWESHLVGSYDQVRRAARSYQRARVTFCPPGHQPSASDLLGQLP